MAAFTDEQIDWRRLDVSALIVDFGLATIDESRWDDCRAWLQSERYRIEQLDCAAGMQALLPQLGMKLHWKEQFGYKIEDGKQSLDALKDGFEFDVPSSGGVVLELVRPDVIWRENREWTAGLFEIASKHSRYHLACGRRFLTLLVLPDESVLIGQKIQEIIIPFFPPKRFRFSSR
jgi:hypothetical protein